MMKKAMRSPLMRILCLLAFLSVSGLCQQVIPLYPGPAPGSAPASYPEKQYYSNAWKTDVVTNVTQPTLTVFRPVPGTSNGTAVVICPGGGFMALSITSEGSDVANWMMARGVTAFLLKYRLAHTGEDATQEFAAAFQDRQKFDQTMATVVPLSIADGLAAVTYVRKHAQELGVSADRVGIVGFSAGGTVAAGVGLQYAAEGRPAFVAPIYPAASMLKDHPVPADAPPIFIAAASDDGLGLAMDSVGLYDRWMDAHRSAELHMYAQGGHGFGMKKQGLPADHWIDRLGDWMESQGWLKK